MNKISKVPLSQHPFMQGLIGAIIGGLFTLAGSYFSTLFNFQKLHDEDARVRRAITEAIRNEMTYNEQTLVSVTPSLRKVILKFRNNKKISVYFTARNLQNQSYHIGVSQFPQLYDPNTSSFLHSLYFQVEYINRSLDNMNTEYRMNSKDFGTELARNKVIEQLEFTSNRCIDARAWDPWSIDRVELDSLCERVRRDYWNLPFNEDSDLTDIRDLIRVHSDLCNPSHSIAVFKEPYVKP
jgi:hypothetical protein